MIKRIKISGVAFILLMLGYTACNHKDFLVLEDPNNLSDANFYQTAEDVAIAVNAAYTGLSNRGLYKRQFGAIEYMNGDFTITSGGFQFAGLNGFNFLPTENDIVQSVWDECYRGIAKCNLVLDRAPEVEDFQDDDLKPLLNRYLAEVRFLRGLYYFHLVTLYGDVPLIQTTVLGATDENFKPKRTDASVIWQAVEEDLTYARDNLPKKEEYASEDLGRASAGAAQGYLGKALLYQEKYSEAASAFRDVMAAAEGGNEKYGTYILLTDFGDVHGATTDNHDESLFEVQFANTGGNIWASDDTGQEPESYYMGTEFAPWGTRFANAYPSDELNQFFDDHADQAGDRRFWTIARYGDDWDGRTFSATLIHSRITSAGGNTGVRKWTDDGKGGGGARLSSGTNMRILRYADILLMYAEAENEVNGPSEAIIELIEKLRQRANAVETDLPAAGTFTKQSLFELIQEERRLELTFEFVRYFDLQRWGQQDLMPGFQTGKNELIPIPQREIDLNENLTQNPGW